MILIYSQGRKSWKESKSELTKTQTKTEKTVILSRIKIEAKFTKILGFLAL